MSFIVHLENNSLSLFFPSNSESDCSCLSRLSAAMYFHQILFFLHILFPFIFFQPFPFKYLSFYFNCLNQKYISSLLWYFFYFYLFTLADLKMAVLLIVFFLLGSLAELPLSLVDHSWQVVYLLGLAICGLSNVWLALHNLPHIFPNCLRLGPPMYSLTHSHAWLPKRINLPQGSVYQPMEYNLPSFLKKKTKEKTTLFFYRPVLRTGQCAYKPNVYYYYFTLL